MEDKNFKKVSVYVLVGILLVLTTILLWPILTSIIFGLILAYMFYPIYKKTVKIIKGKNISALIILILVLLVIIVPLSFLIPIITRQLFDIYTFSQRIDFYSFIKGFLPSGISADLVASINAFISKIVNYILSGLSDVILNLPMILLRLAVVLFVFFFGLRDGDKLVNYAIGLSPFSPALEQKLYKQFKNITNAVVYGIIVIGILQGILTGIGLYIFKSPQPLLLTLLAILGAMVPVLGAWIVWAPVSIYFFFTGNIFAAVGLFLYGAIIVSWVDNILRPYLVARKVKISSAIVFVGMIGGLITFGILGLILGPLLLSYLLILLDAYRNKRFSSLISS